LSREHTLALLEAFLVTFLWSSSYIIVKFVLTQLSPLTLVSLRYITASAVLIPLAFLRGEKRLLSNKKNFLKFAFLGFSGYTIAQGLQCLGLFYLPAVSVTFILNFTPVIVMFLGVLFLGERPSPPQLGGLGLVLLGATFFFNAPVFADGLAGVLITLISGLGWAIYLVSSRFLFVRDKASPLGLTAFSMGFGTLLITVITQFFEGFSSVSSSSLIAIVWLGVANTALAFFLWNHALRRLRVFEISILQNTMLVQIALLSWIFLGEQLTIVKLVSISLVFVGVMIIQLKSE
jgi:drug/metabolite transporter (DMT)-like permease